MPGVRKSGIPAAGGGQGGVRTHPRGPRAPPGTPTPQPEHSQVEMPAPTMHTMFLPGEGRDTKG